MKAWTAHVMQLWNVIMSLYIRKKARIVRISVLLHVVNQAVDPHLYHGVAFYDGFLQLDACLQLESAKSIAFRCDSNRVF